MNELINEIKDNITLYEHTLSRRKKHYEYPFTRSCDHYYSLIILQNTLDVWERCLEVVEKYKKHRMQPVEPFLSDVFKDKMEFEIKRFPGILTENTRFQITDYMKKLEWKVEELEDSVILKKKNTN